MKAFTVLAEALFAILALGVYLYITIGADVDSATMLRTTGLAAGLVSGFLSVGVSILRSRATAHRGILRALELLFSPLGGIVAVVISGTFGAGYLLGSVASFALSHSLRSLLELSVASNEQRKPGPASQ
jgi:hypothetical protein